MKDYAKMNKYDLIRECIKKDSEIDRLKWRLETDKKIYEEMLKEAR